VGVLEHGMDQADRRAAVARCLGGVVIVFEKSIDGRRRVPEWIKDCRTRRIA